MTQRIAEYWAGLQGSVHPDDLDLFGRNAEHGFNLDYPPPAFIGDVVNAPILVLDNNGGFNPTVTPSEFPDEAAHAEFRSRLASPRPAERRATAPYYLELNFWNWLESGQAALVNGVAYRSVDRSAAGVKSLTRDLPSAQFHRRWLVGDVLPLVEAGERFVVIHRWSRWNEAVQRFRGLANCVFSTSSVSPHLSRVERSAATEFLATRN